MTPTVNFNSNPRKIREGENNIFLKIKSKYDIQNLLKINIKQSSNPGITKTKTNKEKLPKGERQM